MTATRSRMPALLLGMLLLASCTTRTSEPPASGVESGSPAGTATTSGRPCENFVEVVETGPQPTDFSEHSPTAIAQARLQNDILSAQAYAAEHPDEFASIRFENAPRVRIVIGFTGHIAEHCAALQAALEHPREFEIIKEALSEARLQELMEEIGDLVGPHLLTLGLVGNHVELTMRQDGEAVAKELAAKYGDVLRIVSIGFLGFPDRSVVVRPCQTLLATKIDTSALRATLVLDATTVSAGKDFEGSVVIRNSGSNPIELNSGNPATAVIYRAGTNELVGGYDAGGEGTGLGGTLAPGQEITADMISGTASCVPELGYTLPPGAYDARAVVEQYQPLDAGGVVTTDILSPPVPFTIIP